MLNVRPVAYSMNSPTFRRSAARVFKRVAPVHRYTLQSVRSFSIPSRVSRSGISILSKPKDIGSESVAWIRPRGATKQATYFPPPESKGGWRKLDNPDDIRKLAGMDPDKLAKLKEWLEQSDKDLPLRNGHHDFSPP